MLDSGLRLMLNKEKTKDRTQTNKPNNKRKGTERNKSRTDLLTTREFLDSAVTPTETRANSFDIAVDAAALSYYRCRYRGDCNSKSPPGQTRLRVADGRQSDADQSLD